MTSFQPAEALAVNGLTQHVCLVAMEMYSQEEPGHLSESLKDGCQDPLTWQGVYCLIVALYSSMLETLSFTFVQDALNFVGVHQERIQMVRS